MVILSMHPQADPDAVGSAIGLTNLIRFLNPKLSIRTLKPKLSALSQKLLVITDFKFDPIEMEEVLSPFLLICLDHNLIDSRFMTPETKIVILDHHIQTDLEVEISHDFRLDSFMATAEIIASLYYQANIPFDSQITKGLLAGILFDSRRFLYADRELFDCVNFLLRDNPNIYSEVMKLFSSFRTDSEKMACIKAAQRMKRFHINNTILLISHVSSYEAAAARSLINIGGDVAIVIANRKQETRISFRTSPSFPKETGISLGKDIIPSLIKQFGGSGGGHDGAAGYNSKILDLNSVKEFLFQHFKTIISEKKM